MKAQTQRRVRQYHLYLGVLFAPLLLLFTVSGIVQTYRIPDKPDAPTWIKWIAAVHKDQAPPREKRARPAAPKGGAKVGAKADEDHDHADKRVGGAPKRPDPLPLKIFVTLMSLGLIVSILLGLTIALNNRATRQTSIVLFIVGAVLPCVLLWL